MTPVNLDAYHLMHEGTLALSRAEQNGLRIDVEYLSKQAGKQQARIDALAKGLDQYPETAEWRQWCRLTRKKFNPMSADQLATVLFDVLQKQPINHTDSGAPSADDETLKAMKMPLCADILSMRKLDKVVGTYIGGILREQTNGWLHPSFGLTQVRTFRGQSEDPNFQNIPVRDPEQGTVIRKSIYPRLGHRLGEDDFKGSEVCVAACYTRDPKLIEYVTNPKLDMHRDMGGEVFILDTIKNATWWTDKKGGKPVRQATKGDFVFASFYGSYWFQTALALWRDIEEYKLTAPGGVPMKEHLADQGIKELGRVDEKTGKPTRGSFFAHVRDVEDRFWGQRFKVYAQWRKDVVTDYYKRGYMDSLTGFRYSGPMSRNGISNYMIQGSSFHCLLWCFIQEDRWLRKNKMDTRLVGQIHDSKLKDYHPDEVSTIVKESQRLVLEDLRQHWPWIVVPMVVEFEISGVDESWNEKKAYKEVAA